MFEKFLPYNQTRWCLQTTVIELFRLTAQPVNLEWSCQCHCVLGLLPLLNTSLSSEMKAVLVLLRQAPYVISIGNYELPNAYLHTYVHTYRKKVRNWQNTVWIGKLWIVHRWNCKAIQCHMTSHDCHMTSHDCHMISASQSFVMASPPYWQTTVEWSDTTFNVRSTRKPSKCWWALKGVSASYTMTSHLLWCATPPERQWRHGCHGRWNWTRWSWSPLWCSTTCQWKGWRWAW